MQELLHIMSVKPQFGLAPMEGVSELPFRLWISQTSYPIFQNTPFLRATDTFPRELPVDFAPELDRYRELVNYELIPQVMTAAAADFVRTAQLFLRQGAAWVDLNAGCPSPNPISGGAGSGLLREAKSFSLLLNDIAKTLEPRTFSLKMRTGFEDHSQFDTHIETLRSIPLKQLTIHGRTRRDRYDGLSRWDLIARAAARLPYDVIPSGDILSEQTWIERQTIFPNPRRVIIGRGALRNPWIFEEIRSGKKQMLSIHSLERSLATLGLLFQAHRTAPGKLEELVLSGCFRAQCGSSDAAWLELYERSCRTLLGAYSAPEDLDFDRPTMGRLKMLWNSLRSSLPECYLEPKLMRASRFGEWMKAWRAYPESLLTLQHHPERDWLYTSSRRAKQQMQSRTAETPEACILESRAHCSTD